MPGVVLHDLSVRFSRRRHPALDGVHVDLDRPGRTVGLFGPNGAGKSTMLRVVVGLLGRFHGRRTGLDPRDIAYLPDRAFLYPRLSVEMCVRLYADRYGDFDSVVARDLLSTLRLDPEMSVGACSKGMSEQLHLALTLARRAPMYVFDEPLAAIDPHTRARVIEMIRTHRRPDATCVLSTHLIDSVSMLFDDVVMIHDGRVTADSSVDHLTSGGSRSLEQAFLDVTESL